MVSRIQDTAPEAGTADRRLQHLADFTDFSAGLLCAPTDDDHRILRSTEHLRGGFDLVYIDIDDRFLGRPVRRCDRRRAAPNIHRTFKPDGTGASGAKLPKGFLSESCSFCRLFDAFRPLRHCAEDTHLVADFMKQAIAAVDRGPWNLAKQCQNL